VGAEYLRLAMRIGAALLSDDQALRAAAIRQGVTVLPEQST